METISGLYKSSVHELSFIDETEFCDSSSNIVDFMANDIVKGLKNKTEIAVRLFDWVQNHITYTVGIYGHKASETLLRRHGSCTNKANLLVALSRACGIPAGFHFYRVKTKKYFGPLCSSRLTQFMSDESVHVFAAFYLDDVWIKIDPTDDDLLSQGGAHLNPPCKKVYFDGRNSALLNLAKEHIVFETEEPLMDVDDYLRKKGRHPQEVIWVMNAYLEYVRTHGKFFKETKNFETRFFNWIETAHPEKYKKFCFYEEALVHQNQQKQVLRERSVIKSKKFNEVQS